MGIGGLVGIGVGGLLGGLASSSWSSSQNQCRSELDCVNRSAALDDRASAVSLATGANIAFIAGAALLVTATVLYFTARSPGGATAALHRGRTLDLIQRF